MTQNKLTNSLINQKSPYLLQHAHNPVDWFAWGDEAFEKANRENKPIFLSIGYSTCHWCHVMAHESFEDEDVAAILNDSFVSIKVDREERPDVDSIYMSVCQMLTGSGGWPLTIFLTPDKKPFYAGTYFPKESKWGRIGFTELLTKIDEIWKTDRQKLLDSSVEITKILKSESVKPKIQEISEQILHSAYEGLKSSFDVRNGGFSQAPKFPMPHNISFLLRYFRKTGNHKALEMVEKTLTEMRLGGLYDQLGFGFHRYSTDEKWLVPHFEKMLYDQSLLAIAYTEAWQVTQNELFKTTAQEILEYILRDMTSPEGGFYSAEDADSEGVEGKFYLWSAKEINAILAENAESFIKALNIKPEGNFVDQVNPYLTGENIPHLKNEAEIGKHENQRMKLFKEREKRIHPSKDDKILTDWNGLMIAAMSKASQVFHDERYSKAAEKAASFIFEKLLLPNGSLLHRYRGGDASFTANLDDYAFLVYGLLELYSATFKAEYLKKAILLTDYMIEHFEDKVNGGFYFTPDNGEDLIVRKKEIYDGAIPSGNSIALGNLLRLSKITENPNYLKSAEKMIGGFSAQLSWSPSAFSQMMSSLDFFFAEPLEIVVVGNNNDSSVIAVTDKLNELFLPEKIIILKSSDSKDISEICKFIESYKAIDDKPTIYLCRNYSCSSPETDLDRVISLLKNEETSPIK